MVNFVKYFKSKRPSLNSQNERTSSFSRMSTPNQESSQKSPHDAAVEILTSVKVATNAIVTSRPVGCCTGFLKEFIAFAEEGDILNLAVAVVIGNAIKQLVTALVNCILTPPIGLATGSLNLENIFFVLKPGHASNITDCANMSTMAEYKTVAVAQQCGAVVIAFGAFVQSAIDFIVTAFAIFLLVKVIRGEAVKELTKECTQCCASIPLDASICPKCRIRVKSAATRKCPHCCDIVDNRAILCPSCRSELKPVSIASQQTKDSLYEKSFIVREIEMNSKKKK